jgi:DNA-directed RNA polymerase delta subunit
LLQHKGNKRFLDVIALHRPDYVRAPKIQKPSVARVIVRLIRNGDTPGRFIRKDDKTGKWVDIGDKKAVDKTAQALREKKKENRKSRAKKPEEAKTDESKADDDKEKTDDKADEEADDKEGEEKKEG